MQIPSPWKWPGIFPLTPTGFTSINMGLMLRDDKLLQLLLYSEEVSGGEYIQNQALTKQLYVTEEVMKGMHRYDWRPVSLHVPFDVGNGSTGLDGVWCSSLGPPHQEKQRYQMGKINWEMTQQGAAAHIFLPLPPSDTAWYWKYTVLPVASQSILANHPCSEVQLIKTL